jgi:pimeloyl-ACP methyl ester carboxylesterase
MIMELPDTQYVQTDHGEIAYQVYGDGPVDLVAVGGPASHLEVAWENGDATRYLERLGSIARVVRFDRRGTGLSDPPDASPSLEDHASDLAVVMDAVGLERAAVLGEGDAGRLCALYAASEPARVSKLVVYGTSARGRAVLTPARRAMLSSLIEEQWGEGTLMALWAPSKAGDAAFVRWWRRFEQAATSRETALDLVAMTEAADLRDVVGRIRAPTLVLHRRDDQLVPVGLGRDLAERIPDARFVELPGVDNLVFVGEVDPLLDEIERFLADQSSSEAA